MPIHIILGCPPGEVLQYTSTDDYVQKRQEMMRDANNVVREHLGAAAVRRKDYYDTRVKEAKFTKGTWVWYLYPRRRVVLSPKWQQFYTGPYLIVRVLPPNDVVLQKSKTARSFVVHKDQVKMFFGEAPPSWLRNSPVPTEMRRQTEQACDESDVHE